MKYVFFLVVVFTSCATKEKNEAVNYFNTSFYKKVSSYSDSVQNMYVIYRSIIDTNRTLMKYYWDNGKLQSKSFFYLNKLDGPSIQYFDNGKISFEGVFEMGKIKDGYRIYSTDGLLIKKNL